MSLLNIRLSRIDEEAVSVLKAAHVELSAVIREALHKEANKFRRRSKSVAATLVQEVFADYPEPKNPSALRFNAHDRREFAAAMRRHLKNKRRRSKARPR